VQNSHSSILTNTFPCYFRLHRVELGYYACWYVSYLGAKNGESYYRVVNSKPKRSSMHGSIWGTYITNNSIQAPEVFCYVLAMVFCTPSRNPAVHTLPGETMTAGKLNAQHDFSYPEHAGCILRALSETRRHERK